MFLLSSYLLEKKVAFTGEVLTLAPQYEMKLRALTAEVLAADQNGNPVFGVNKTGKGKVYFCNVPLEYIAVTTPSFVDGANYQAYHKLYEAMGIGKAKIAKKQSPHIGVTEHIESEEKAVVLVINYLPKKVTEDITLTGFEAVSVDSVRGDAVMEKTAAGLSITLEPNSGAVIELTKK